MLRVKRPPGGYLPSVTSLQSAPPAPGALVRAALETASAPSSRRDRFLVLLDVYDLALAPVTAVGAAARLLTDPDVVRIKTALEGDWIAELDQVRQHGAADPGEQPATDALRALATRERLPAVYRWLARDAELDQVRRFLALEGGPDGGFDDLVAICQVGLGGRPKQEMARNYWDEMGGGDPAEVHTTLHQQMAAALRLPAVPRGELPDEALERAALGGLLATNRWLQPEMTGALGLIELQAGPRCRLVLQALTRTGAPAAALPFYEVHADVDPRHGKDWLDEVVEPLCTQHPELAGRVVRGARWRWSTNAAFFDRMARDLVPGTNGTNGTNGTVLAA